MTRQIVLLRGINVGAHRRVMMADLRALLEAQGYGVVRTLGQSGNVVISGSETTAPALERLIEAELGVDPLVVLRTREELADVVERNPFAEIADDPKRLQVSFLGSEPKPAVVEEIGSADHAPEQVAFSGREVYAWHPSGLQDSALAKLLTDKRLGVTATARNWNTVNKLLALADETTE